MKLQMVNLPKSLQTGFDIMKEEFGFETTDVAPDYVVHVENTEKDHIFVEKQGKQIDLRYGKKIRFFRALTRMLQHLKKDEDFVIEETPSFDLNGAMFDTTQGNAALLPKSIKRLIVEMAKMGLNMLMIYTEDNYVMEDEPFFGYMRGAYTEDELRECDQYADLFGIEMIPCMQTLAHLYDSLKWPVYNDFKDDDDTLLVGHPKTYEFIERMIVHATRPFRTRRVHIGMDEAMHLGLGRYLHKNAYRQKYDIMTEHLARVMEILQRHDLKPMMWSDMFFRAVSKTNDYYDTNVSFSEEMITKIPDNMQLVYWDYYHDHEDFYEKYIDLHQTLTKQTIFAGAVWSWIGFGTNYEKTFRTTDAALQVCKRKGVREVFATIWGDDTTESNPFSTLLGLQLYAEHDYMENPTREEVFERFSFTTGVKAEHFFALDRFDRTKDTDPLSPNTAKVVMWQDLMMGLFDENIKEVDLTTHYTALCEDMKQYAATANRYEFLFDYMAHVADVLAVKGDLGKKIDHAYRTKNHGTIKKIVQTVLPDLKERIVRLRDIHRSIWYSINKPQGWEIMDIRYGGLISRIDSVSMRLDDYAKKKVDRLEELEGRKLPFGNRPGLTACNDYTQIPSASRISIGVSLR